MREINGANLTDEELQRELARQFRPSEDNEQNDIAVVGFWFNVTFCTLGIVALILNVLVLSVLLMRRKEVRKSAFYVILGNVAFSDILRSACLIFWAVRALVEQSASVSDQIVLYVLRFFNITAVLNILLLTLNEFLAIRYPVRYNAYNSPGLTTLIPIFTSWLLAFLGVGLTFYVRHSTPKTFLIRADANYSWQAALEGNSTWLKDNSSDDEFMLGGLELGILCFCFLCFIIIIACHIWFLRKLYRRRQNRRWGSNLKFLRVHFGTPRQVSDPDVAPSASAVLVRYKYILVIGSVTIVYGFYLLSYSAITLIQYVRMQKPSLEDQYPIQIARWCFQLAVILHAVLQPLCYLRFKQFSKMTLYTFSTQRSRTILMRSRTLSQGKRSMAEVNSENHM